jgi:thioredoxin-dependent peroxiredoxin
VGSLLKVGDQAPAFDVTSSKGESLKLADFRGKKNVVLYFYPKDETPVCTAEACGFRDMYEDLKAADTQIIGVSPDSNESHEAFAKRQRITFPLVSDPQKKLAEAYGATGGLWGVVGMLKRVTYVIDKDGKVAAVVQNALSADAHFDAVKNALGDLTGAVAY